MVFPEGATAQQCQPEIEGETQILLAILQLEIDPMCIRSWALGRQREALPKSIAFLQR